MGYTSPSIVNLACAKSRLKLRRGKGPIQSYISILKGKKKEVELCIGHAKYLLERCAESEVEHIDTDGMAVKGIQKRKHGNENLDYLPTISYENEEVDEPMEADEDEE